MHFAFSPTFVPHPRYSTLDSSINSSINEECFYLNLFAVLTFILFIPIVIQARLLWILHWEWRLILYSCFDLHSETGTTDTQRELFFRKSQTFGLGQTNWAENFRGIWGIFGQTTAPILALWVPCPWFWVFYCFFLKSSRNKKDLNDVTAAPSFWWFFCCWQLRKRHRKQGICDIIKVLLIPWRL